MVKIKDMDTIVRRYARNSLRAFLEGSKTLAWVLGIIWSSGVRGQALEDIFEGLQGYGDSSRFHDAYQACSEMGLL